MNAFLMACGSMVPDNPLMFVLMVVAILGYLAVTWVGENLVVVLLGVLATTLAATFVARSKATGSA